jgi:hypothetical protein
MSKIKVHEKDCINRLGKPYNHVHRFLDQYAKQYHGSKRHRKHLHNKKGLSIIKNKWGQKAYQAGKIHLWRDRKENSRDYIMAWGKKFGML